MNAIETAVMPLKSEACFRSSHGLRMAQRMRSVQRADYRERRQDVHMGQRRQNLVASLTTYAVAVG
jgi:hypothetical protein